jgi:uncharacterized damage-inducible protein DinB
MMRRVIKFVSKSTAMIGEEYLKTVIKRVKYYKDLADKAMAQLDENDFLVQPSSESNSIAVIIQHMAGNMLSRWTNFLTEDGEKEWRRRDEEFANHPTNKAALLDMWEKGWTCYLEALQSLTSNDLLKTVTIRQEPLTVIDAINRQLAHYPYHVGQIVYIARLLKNDAWQSLSIPRGASLQYNQGDHAKDPAKKFG